MIVITKYCITLEDFEVDANNDQIFDEIGNGKPIFLVQGDFGRNNLDQENPKIFTRILNNKKQYKFVLAGTGSYSPSIMTINLK